MTHKRTLVLTAGLATGLLGLMLASPDRQDAAPLQHQPPAASAPASAHDACTTPHRHDHVGARASNPRPPALRRTAPRPAAGQGRQALLQAIAHQTNPYRRQRAIYQLVNQRHAIDRQAIDRLTVVLLDSRDDRTRRLALWALSESPHKDEAAEPAIAALRRSRSADVRLAAMRALAVLGRGLEEISLALRGDEAAAVRAQAATHLATSGRTDRATVDALSGAALTDPAPRVRRAAISALSAIGNAAARAELERVAVSGQSAGERARATDELETLTMLERRPNSERLRRKLAAPRAERVANPRSFH